MRLISSTLAACASPDPVSRPRRSTVKLSQKAFTSRNLWLIISTVTSPRLAISPSSPSTSSASPGVSTEVGSSRMRKRCSR